MPGRTGVCPSRALTLTGAGERRAGAVTPPVSRGHKGSGSIAEVRDGVFKLTVTAGTHGDGRQRRAVRRVQGTKTQAARMLADLVAEVGDGAKIPLPDGKDLRSMT